VAAVFAIHPLRVESVAWIAERKDVLSGVFFLLTLSAYVRYVRRPSSIRYLVVAVVFSLGLMTKPMLVTLPFVLLVLDYWPLRRFRPAGLVETLRRLGVLTLEKWPFFLLAIASCVVTFRAQLAEAVVPLDRFPVPVR